MTEAPCAKCLVRTGPDTTKALALEVDLAAKLQDSRVKG